jgi:hypothetical protein
VKPALINPGPDDWINTGAVRCQAPAQNQPALTIAQFRRLPIPAPTISAQPDPQTRHTLINIPTNLYTSGQPATLTTIVLGQRIAVRATPALFHWTYGDGEQLVTRRPGRPYPDMPTAHTFTRPGTHTVRLSTTFTGEYSVSGGPWQPVQGTATLPSPPLTITADESRAVLVG